MWTEQVASLSKQVASLSKNVGNVRLSLPKILQRTRTAPSEVNASEWFQCGVVAHEKRQYIKALDAWKEAAAQGYAEAQYRIGLLYARGDGVVRSIPDAVVWFTRAAEDGHVEAQFQLGAIYANGSRPEPIGPDNWFKSASQRNGEVAQRNLNTLFPNGIAVEKDLDAAIRWMMAAARSGKMEAQNVLGEMCRRGLGTKQNYEFARGWYLLAAKQGNAAAQFG